MLSVSAGRLGKLSMNAMRRCEPSSLSKIHKTSRYDEIAILFKLLLFHQIVLHLPGGTGFKLSRVKTKGVVVGFFF